MVTVRTGPACAFMRVGVQHLLLTFYGQSSLLLRPCRCQVLRHRDDPIGDGVGVDDLVQMLTR
jgi:hypothetical protein